MLVIVLVVDGALLYFELIYDEVLDLLLVGPGRGEHLFEDLAL